MLEVEGYLWDTDELEELERELGITRELQVYINDMSHFEEGVYGNHCTDFESNVASIEIKSGLEVVEARFSLFHELAHAVQHQRPLLDEWNYERTLQQELKRIGGAVLTTEEGLEYVGYGVDRPWWEEEADQIAEELEKDWRVVL